MLQLLAVVVIQAAVRTQPQPTGHGGMRGMDSPSAAYGPVARHAARKRARADPSLGPANLQSAALAAELCARMLVPSKGCAC